MITIEVGFGETRKIPWGRFSLPGISGYIQTSAEHKDGRICFAITGEALYQSAMSMQDQITLLAEQSKKKVVEPTFNEVIGSAVASQLAPVLAKIEEMQRVSLRLSKIIP